MTQLLERAFELQKAGEYEKSLKLGLEVLQAGKSLHAARLVGLTLLSQNRIQEAEDYFIGALQVYKDDPVLMSNLGSLYYNLGRDDEATFWILKSCFVQKEVGPIYRYLRSQVYLKNGKWKDGWEDYQYRFAAGESKLMGVSIAEFWQGEWLGPDKTLMIWGEGGYGDNIQLVRFVGWAKERSGAQVKLGVDKALHRLFEKCLPGTEFAEELGYYHCPMFHLPKVFDVMPDTLNGKSYLELPKEVKENENFIIGLCWEGRQDKAVLRDRSMSEGNISQLCDIEGCTFISLQYGVWGFRPSDWYDTALAIAACDLVVTIDTGIAHLAGALGVPTFLMLRYQGDFRWLRDRTDTPWYNSVKLYRQPSLGDWNSVLESVKRSIKEIFCYARTRSRNDHRSG